VDHTLIATISRSSILIILTTPWPKLFPYTTLCRSRLEAIVRGIPNGDRHFLLTATIQYIGYIKGKGRISSLMLAHFLSVYPHSCPPIHGAEMEQQPLGSQIIGYFEGGTIPQFVIWSHTFFNP